MADGAGSSANSTTAQLDVSEVYFLVLKWLSNGPCKNAAQALSQDVVQQGLLPPRYDIHGGSQASSYQSLQQQYSSTPAEALVQLLQQVLDKVHAGGHAGAQGLQTLLAQGPLAALPALAHPQQPSIAPWLVNPARAATMPQQLLLQQAGLTRGADSCRLPKQLLTEWYCHHATFRGHGFPVFALLYDKTGQRVITGADDANIKIWSLTTGLLLATGRGHTGEISDLSLSADGSMVASGAVDGDVRVWSMQNENLGQNMAVLTGHTAPVSLIDFHPKIPSALLSASHDGTVRLWDARDQHFAPLLLVPSENFGAFNAMIGKTSASAAAAAAAAARPAGAAQAGSGAAPANEQQEQKGVLWCCWSPDGTSIAAGSQDGCTYIWYWDVCMQQQQQRQQQHISVISATTDSAPAEQHNDAQQLSAPAVSQPEQQSLVPGTNPFEQFRRQLERDLQQKQQQQLQRQRSRRNSSSSQRQGQLQLDLQQQPAQADIQPQEPQQQQQQQQRQPAQQFAVSADWPAPVELQRLAGHKNEVLHVEWSHSGSMLATASLDGTVRLWQQVKRSGRLRLAWEEACCPLMVVAASPAAAAAGSKAKPRRQQAATLVINWLVWACDDRQVLAAASDNNIRVWCPRTGALLRLLSGHTQQAHVLHTHPLNPHLAMSAGYDGQVILWDTAHGTVIKRFSSSDTIPLARGSWAPPVIQLCDGQFSPDGNSFIVSDVAGQFSIYAMGPPTPLLLSAPYDQFFKKDYDGIMHDAAGFAAYLEPAAVPTHFLAKEQPLCDNQFKPYPDDFQEAYREGRVLEYVKAGGGGMQLRGSSMELPSSLAFWPPTVTAAVWKALEDRAAAAARQSRVASEETVRDTAEGQAFLEHSRLLAALARGMTLQEEEQRILQLATAAANRQQQLNPQPQQQQQWQVHQEASTLVARAAGAAGMADFVALSDDYEDNEREVDDAGDLAGSDSDYADQVITDDSDWDDASDLEDELDDVFDSEASAGRRQRQAQRHSERQRQRQRRTAAAAEADGMVLRSRRGVAGAGAAEDDDDWGPRVSRSRAGSRRTTPAERCAPQRPRRSNKRRRNDDKFDYNQADTDSEQQEPEDDDVQQGTETPPVAAAAACRSEREQSRQRRSVRQRNEAAAAAAAVEATTTQDDSAARTGQLHGQQHPENGAAETAAAPVGAWNLQGTESDAAAASNVHLAQRAAQAKRREAAAARRGETVPAAATGLRRSGTAGGSYRPGRAYDCYAWLSEATHNPNTYVPQIGDTVVYLWEGHLKYLDAKCDRLTQRPSEVLSRGGPALQQLQWQLQLQVQQQQAQWQLHQHQTWLWQHQWQQQADMHYSAALPAQQQQDHQVQPGWQQLQQQFKQLYQLQQQEQQQQQHLQSPPEHAAAAAVAGARSGALVGEATSGLPETMEAVAGTQAPPFVPAVNWQGGPADAVAGQVEAAPQSAATSAAAGTAAAAAVLPPATAAAELAQECGEVVMDPSAAQNAAAAMQYGGSFGMAALSPVLLESYQMRPAETCTIVALEYAIQDDQTVAVLTLQLTAAVAGAPAEGLNISAAVDDQQKQQQQQQQQEQQQGTSVPGLYFQVTLPAPSTGHAEFLILQSRFEASVKQQWQIGDRVQNYQLEADHSEGGQWYVGTVVEDKRITRPNAEVAADPYSCGGLWERYRVRWNAEDEEVGEQSQQLDVADAGSGSPKAIYSANGSHIHGEEEDASWLSPWELYAADLSTEAVLAAEHRTQLTGEQVAVLLHALEQLLSRGKYRMFRAAPAPSDVYDTADGCNAYNRVIPLPLGLEHIQERLMHGYYRNLQALMHDVSLIASNAAAFNGADSPLAAKAQEVCEFIQVAAAAGATAPSLSQWLNDRKELANVAAAAAGFYQDTMGPSLQQQQQHSAGFRFIGKGARTGKADAQQQQPTPQRSRRSAAQKAIMQFASGYDEHAIGSDSSDEDLPEDDGERDDEDDEADKKVAAAAATAARSRQARGSGKQHSQRLRQRLLQRQRQRPNRKQRAYREDYSTPETSEAEPNDAEPIRRSSRQRKGQQPHYKSGVESDSDGKRGSRRQQHQRPRRGLQQQQQHDGQYDFEMAGQQHAAATWLQHDGAALAVWQQQQHQYGSQQLINQDQQLQQEQQFAHICGGQERSQQVLDDVSQQQLDAAAGAAMGIPAAAQAALAAAADAASAPEELRNGTISQSCH